MSSGQDLPKYELSVLLIDDQAIIGEAVRRMLLSEPDLIFHFCSDPTKAMAMALEIKPKVILQDLVMPQVDGLSLLKQFREETATKDIPMIVLSSKEEPKVKAEAFGLGANDYLVKLPDKIELIARIRYHAKAYVNLLERNEAFDALSASQQKLAAELDEAAEYVRSLLPPTLAGDIETSWKFVTSTELGGDAFGYHWLDPDHFVIYLLDVCGHGVGAALLSVSAMNVLRSQTLTGVDFKEPIQVLGGLNEAFDMDKQNQMYFTIWYGVFNKNTREIKFASGGHPPALLVTPDGATVTELRAQGLVIGALPTAKFNQDACIVPKDAKLYVFSDGVYEVTRPDGPMMQLEEFAEIVRAPGGDPKDRVGEIKNRVVAEHGADEFVDDFSLLELILH
jgi:sigma-B regulation protein RsbU (phosphoserine phosphatase)